MADNEEINRYGYSISVSGAVILSIIYILQTQFQREFILAPGTTLLVALVAALGALMFYYAEQDMEEVRVEK